MTKRAALIFGRGKSPQVPIKSEGWQDKALAELSGKPLLIQAIENVKGVVDEIVVCVNDEERKEKYGEILKKHALTDVQIAVDEKNAYQRTHRGNHVWVEVG